MYRAEGGDYYGFDNGKELSLYGVLVDWILIKNRTDYDKVRDGEGRLIAPKLSFLHSKSQILVRTDRSR